MSAVIDVSDRRFISRPWTAAVDPAVTNDRTKGVQVGDTWFNTATGNIFDAVAVTAGAAIWRPRPRTLAQSFAPVSCAADTAENTLATITVPANAMGANGCIEVDTLWTFTNSGNNKTLSVHFGGLAGSSYLALIATTTATARELTRIANANATNAQTGMPGGKDSGVGLSAGALTTGAVDTTASTTIVISGTKASAGETLTLVGYTARLFRPDIGP